MATFQHMKKNGIPSHDQNVLEVVTAAFYRNVSTVLAGNIRDPRFKQLGVEAQLKQVADGTRNDNVQQHVTAFSGAGMKDELLKKIASNIENAQRHFKELEKDSYDAYKNLEFCSF